MDKTSVKAGEIATFTVTSGDFSSRVSATPWVDLYTKAPGAADFVRGQGTRFNEKPYSTSLIDFRPDSTYALGTYTFYAKVRNCKDIDDDGCKRISNSGEIQVTLTH